MIDIERNSLKVYEKSIIPAINFIINDNLENDTILLKIEGVVLGADWKYIANIVELPDMQLRNNPTTIDGRLRVQASKLISIVNDDDDNNNKNNQQSTTVKPFRLEKQELMFALDKNILRHIEQLRQKSKNNDVILYFIFRASYLKHWLKLGTYATNAADQIQSLARSSEVDNSKIRILDTNDMENKVFSYTIDEFRRQVVISSNDWINNFQMPLNNLY